MTVIIVIANKYVEKFNTTSDLFYFGKTITVHITFWVAGNLAGDAESWFQVEGIVYNMVQKILLCL